MGAREKLILGSRGSELALVQARLAADALRGTFPDLEVTIEIIRTSGDEGSTPMTDRKAGRKGMFTREIEKRLLVRQIDLAVHSAKDLPSVMPNELQIGAALARANTEDVLITKGPAGLTSLPAGATIATGSVRRQHQLRLLRPDLHVTDLRGNVPTRVRRLEENAQWSGIILARAGLERLGLPLENLVTQILAPNDFVPAGGQGIIALQIRRDDMRSREMAERISDRLTMLALRAEREFLRLLEGDCDSPVGVHAEISHGRMELRAQVFAHDSSPPKTGSISGSPNEPEALAQLLMKQIYGR